MRVILFNDMGVAIDSTITDSNGDYFFGGLAEGTYTVGIPASAFGTGQGLENYPNSSTDIATSGADNNTVRKKTLIESPVCGPDRRARDELYCVSCRYKWRGPETGSTPPW